MTECTVDRLEKKPCFFIINCALEVSLRRQFMARLGISAGRRSELCGYDTSDLESTFFLVSRSLVKASDQRNALENDRGLVEIGLMDE